MRYHLFADETGQQSQGEYFLVGVVAVPTAELEAIRVRVVDIELRSQRAGRKWSRSTLKQKVSFLDLIVPLLDLLAPVYYRSCGPGLLYSDWTADIVASAAETRDAAGDYTVVVDGDPDYVGIRVAFKRRKLKFRMVRGGRDESEPLLRLADFVAGFTADRHRGRPYALPYWSRLERHFQAV